MNIIAHNGANVNIVFAKSAKTQINVKTARRIAKAKLKRMERLEESKKPTLQRWQDHKADAIIIAERLIKAGLRSRGEKIKMCGTELIFDRCADCGQVQLKSAVLCRDRLCPLCSWRLAVRRYASMSRVINYLYAEHPDYNYSMVVLTCQNCRPSEIKQTLRTMQKAWHECLKQRWAVKSLEGWARSIEVTYNTDNNAFHPHYHIILMSQERGAAKWLIAEWIEKIRAEGLKATAAAQFADVITSKEHSEGASLASSIVEVYKYSIKATDTKSMPLGSLRELAIGISNVRLISMGGLIKKAAKLLDADDMEQPEDKAEDEPTKMCTRCKSTKLDEIVLRWSMAGNHYNAISDRGTVESLAQAIIDHASKEVQNELQRAADGE